MIKPLIIITIFSFSILDLVRCQSNYQDSGLKIIIKEKTYTSQIYPTKSKFKLSSESEYFYQNKLLIEKRTKKVIKVINKDKQLITREIYEYTKNNLAKKLTYIGERNDSPKYEEVYTYNSDGKWKSKQKRNSDNRLTEELRVDVRKNDKLEGTGLESRGKLKFIVGNNQMDSIVYLTINHKGKEILRESQFEKNKFGEIVSEKVYINQDSLILSRSNTYEYENADFWKSKISKVMFINYDGIAYQYIDSTHRVNNYYENSDFSKVTLLGNWYFEDSSNDFISFKDNNEFIIFERGQLSASGIWALSTPQKRIILNLLEGDDRGEKITWEYKFTSNDTIIFSSRKNTKILRKKK